MQVANCCPIVIEAAPWIENHFHDAKGVNWDTFVIVGVIVARSRIAERGKFNRDQPRVPGRR